MILANFRILALCCAQFCERVQLDSIVYNELGHPDDLISEGSGDIEEFKSLPRYATFQQQCYNRRIQFFILARHGAQYFSNLPVIARM